ncbi:drug/metabolite transporter (DMT)-like permease [Nocardia transvalensis]|uniref:Drug/metabolite transporter (DMT)-like permease n=1 Tax=Nocardia transvalensis TaxID=37333 RepID=A0A7W9PD31_9NOCA|nr:DMT family transporter [Nocardia transvalensis]MBB5913942.1 drug/metabolite transporter (DMT)-like permease [Nocardia transvalensis]
MDTVAPTAFVLMWSSAFIVGIVGVGAAPPFLVLFARFGLAGVALTLYALAVGARWPRGAQLGHAIVAGLLMQLVQFSAFYTAMADHVSAAVISLVQGLNPVVIALFAGRVLGEKVSVRQWLGFGIGGVGVGLAVADQSAFSLAGVLLCVVGLLGLSLGTVYQKRFTPAIDSRSSTAVHVLASAPIVGLLAVVHKDFHVSDPASLAIVLVWMVLINSMGAFLLLNAMLRRWDTTRVGKLFFATPAVTALMAWLIIGQSLRPLTIAGLAVGVLGMILASRRTRGDHRDDDRALELAASSGETERPVVAVGNR